MAFSSNSSGGGPMADINVTPLVDVMLVLLIIFMITAPLMTHKVKIELPKANVVKEELKAPPVTVAIKANGEIYFNDVKVNKDELEFKLDALIPLTPQPQVNIRADKNTKYKIINDAVNTIQGRGVRKVGFVSSPQR